MATFDDSRPIFIQIAELVESEIVAGTMAEEAQVPSTNEFAAYYRINPATAAKGVNLLVETGILYKKRGIGMFVSSGAREQLLQVRRNSFQTQYIQPLAREARKLGIDGDQLSNMIRQSLAADAAEGSVIP
ncbi:GntR family transcriptional regulator [Paeniglutamicibacter sp. MACA_103]|uniref:GntR family transcriptional regulator n=1 Tax=Paeniglutamicibacter sp. MACA_103 TaxID=3377337 RepID=UPI003896596F